VLPDADAVAAALGSTWVLLASTLETGWAREADGLHGLVTGMPVPTLNGAWVLSADASATQVQAELDAVNEEDVPFCLQCRSSWRSAGQVIASARGLTTEPDIPLMARAGPLEAAPAAGLSVRHLERGEAHVHCEVAGPAFGAPPELFAQLVTDEVLGLAEVTGYVGRVSGEEVVTALSVTVDDAVGIFNVATLPAHRGRGYGAAITATATREAFERGAAYAWLQSSQAGYGVYERLGFATLERWPCWVSSA
jgi:ribosomal protein S18 acetylase RimI-like enzyme